MRSAIVVLSLVVAIAAEAPYHLPRPAAHAPAFRYPIAPAPAPPPPPPPPPPPLPAPLPQPRLPPQPQYVHYPSQHNYVQSSGYQYQQPSIAPAFVQFAPQPQFAYQSPAPFPVSYPQPQPVVYNPPSTSYGLPQLQNAPRPVLPVPAVVAPQPLLQPQLQPQPQPAQVYQPISHYQQQQGYSYQQPPPQPIQYTSQLPLQVQPVSSNTATSSLSSYQADSNQYSSVPIQTHGDALDATVVDRVQNIIKENEHSSARNAGFLSLVSGVSLEGAKPSVEISSFVQNSPLTANQGVLNFSSVSESSSSSAAVSSSGPSSDYGLPSITANSQLSQSEISLGFLPHSKPAASYGAPNK